jgi:Tfp pilus assembly protein FimT
MMELLVFIAVLTLLIALADRFGVDSRNNLRSSGTELSELGFGREPRTRSGKSTISWLSEERM